MSTKFLIFYIQNKLKNEKWSKTPTHTNHLATYIISDKSNYFLFVVCFRKRRWISRWKNGSLDWRSALMNILLNSG